MSFDLEPESAQVSTLDDYEAEASSDERKGFELVDGIWVEKHPLEPPPEENRKGCELIDGEWVEKPMSNTAGLVATNITLPLTMHVRANGLGFSRSQNSPDPVSVSSRSQAPGSSACGMSAWPRQSTSASAVTVNRECRSGILK